MKTWRSPEKCSLESKVLAKLTTWTVPTLAYISRVFKRSGLPNCTFSNPKTATIAPVRSGETMSEIVLFCDSMSHDDHRRIGLLHPRRSDQGKISPPFVEIHRRKHNCYTHLQLVIARRHACTHENAFEPYSAAWLILPGVGS